MRYSGVEAMRVVVGDVVRIDDYRARRRPPNAAPAGGATPDPPSARAGARWISRVAPAFNLPITRENWALAAREREAVTRHPVWADPSLDARDLPVMLIGGLAGTVEQLRLLEQWLSRLNCRVRIASTGFGVDCGERTVARVTEELTTLAEGCGQRCVLIGHSRGGQFARAISVRNPEL